MASAEVRRADETSFPSLALSRSGSEGVSHPRLAVRFAGPLACAALRQRAHYTRMPERQSSYLLSPFGHHVNKIISPTL